MFKHQIAHSEYNWKELRVEKGRNGSVKIHIESHNWADALELDFVLDADYLDQLLLELNGEGIDNGKIIDFVGER